MYHPILRGKVYEFALASVYASSLPRARKYARDAGIMSVHTLRLYHELRRDSEAAAKRLSKFQGCEA